MRCEWITESARLAAIAPEWDRLADAGSTPFMSSTWLLAWWRTVAVAHGGLRILALWRDDRLVGGFPVQHGPLRRWEGAVEHGTPPLVPVLAADSEARERLAAELASAAPAEMRLHALPADAGVDALLHALAAARRRVVVEGLDPTLVVDIAGSFADYRARLSSKVRSEVGRLERKAAREHQVEIVSLASPRDVDAQWSRLVELEAAGWKGRGGSSLAQQPRVAAFFAELSRSLDAAGALRFSELSIDGGLAGVAWSIIHGGRCFTLKVAYDERYRRLGPGFILLMAMLERCFELGYSAYEFSGTAEDYERRFATSERPRLRLRAYGSGPAGHSLYAYREHVRPGAGRLRDAARMRFLRGEEPAEV